MGDCSSPIPTSRLILTATFLIALSALNVSNAADLVTLEAESGTVGADFAVNSSGSPAYISIQSDTAAYNPGSAARVASYSVTFPSAGTYELYARLRVGAGGYNDDSMFFATSFGSKSPTLNSDWVFVNGLAPVGSTADSEVVTGGGSAGFQVWKWINLSQFAGKAGFTVSAGGLTQTFQIGAREDGLDMDKFVFGTAGTAFAVSNLDSGTIPQPPPPPPPLTNAFPEPDGIALHRFSPLDNGLNADGAKPAAGLALLGDVLCGTTLSGGSQGAGTAFYVSLDGTNFNAFASFTNALDAGDPQGDLVVSGNGFFGTTFGGGNAGTGTVIVGQTNGGISVLRSFASVDSHTAANAGGASPSGQLVLSGSKLYGTATAGGAAANGTIFSLTTNGLTLSVLHNFSLLDSQTGTNVDGAAPSGGLIADGDTLYGTASGGGAGGNGVVFSINKNGGNLTTLHSFSPMDVLAATNADGAIPCGGLVLSNGTLYGTTFAGGEGGRGTIFSVETNGVGFTVLHHFTATDSATATNADGASPSSALLLSSDALYGTASAGGEGAAGTVYSLSLDGAQLNVLHTFEAVDSSGTNRYGAFPVAPVLKLGSALYGTAFGGGPGGSGTVFRIPLPVPPAVISNIIPNGDGTVLLHFLGGSNSTNVIQAAGSLASPIDWQDVSTNIADSNGAWQFSESINGTARFYRSYAR